jgi:VanZ family protein
VKGFARYWLPPIVWMAAIWGFSTDVGSAEHTSGVVAWILGTLFPWLTPTQIEPLHALIRKLGHLTEYAILALLWFRALRGGRGLPATASTWAALAISIAWAIVDELHQSVVPSRTASSFDVLLDSTGATVALLIARLAGWGVRDAPKPPWFAARSS